ncbi:MAG: protein kinase [Myxococcota bacterium]
MLRAALPQLLLLVPLALGVVAIPIGGEETATSTAPIAEPDAEFVDDSEVVASTTTENAIESVAPELAPTPPAAIANETASTPTESPNAISRMTLDEAASLLDEPEAAATPAAPEVWSGSPSERLEALQAMFPAFWWRGLADIQAGRPSVDAAWSLACIAGFLLLMGLFARIAQGSGTVAVCIDYPPGLRGTFHVRIARRTVGPTRSGKFTSPADVTRAGVQGVRSRSKSRFGVSRETQFLRVPCRRRFVTVDGYLQTAESEDVVAAHFAEQEVTPKRGETVPLRFDFQPRACPVEVRVSWGDRSLEEAKVARYGAPGSLRLVRGPVQYSLDVGTHRLVAGSTDRVAEVCLEIESFAPRNLVLDLGDREQLLFTGCPAAVEPYLNGDVASAARHLEREGQSRVANLLLANFHRDHDRMETAAQHFEKAGEAGTAAELYAHLERYDKAALLFEQVGDDERAGEMYRSSGQLTRAGDAYSRAELFDSAVDCFRDAGETQRWIEALSKQGRHLEAAKVAIDENERTQAIQCLNRVSTSDPNYPEAVMDLAEAYQNEGHLDLATAKLEELLATRADDEVPNGALDRLAGLYELGRDTDRALQLLERLRLRDATWPHVATRVDALRKAKGAQTTLPDPTQPTLVAEGFSDTGRYEILEELGRGGMGIVFRARDRRLGREVALKRLPDHIRNHPKAIQLFLREARAAAALNHPNIVTLFDAGQESETFYITMELLQGSPLQAILRDKGQLKPGIVAKLGGQVATGLQYAHEQGIVHRDIKTANLFLTKKRAVKIMDFGLAKMVEEVRRSTTVIGGTPYYMAPEQSAGEQVDHRADLYALGVTFFELLTGRVPFKDGDVTFHHRHTPAPDVRTVVPEVSPELAALVAHLLEKNPADRIRSAAEVVERLSAIARA